MFLGVGRTVLTARTPSTVTTRPLLLRELRSTRRRGYAIDHGEFQTGLTSLAVPIRPATRLVGAVTLTGPTQSFDTPRAAHAARVAAQMIESRLATRP